MSRDKTQLNKGEINYLISLNEEQKEVKRLIIDNQIVIVTGQAGSGKSLVCAQVALDLLMKKDFPEVTKILNTRAMVEVGGESMGFLPGDVKGKFGPYMDGFQENLEKCYKPEEIKKFIEEEKIQAYPVGFIRSKTVDDVLIVEEGQNMSQIQMLSIITRLGKTGRIIINGDNEQQDTPDVVNGLKFVIQMSKRLTKIKHIHLQSNHRSGLVKEILDYVNGKI